MTCLDDGPDGVDRVAGRFVTYQSAQLAAQAGEHFRQEGDRLNAAGGYPVAEPEICLCPDIQPRSHRQAHRPDQFRFDPAC